MFGRWSNWYSTWTPAPGMTQKQIDKELEKQKVLFEERVRNGLVLNEKMKFSELAQMWLDDGENTRSPDERCQGHKSSDCRFYKKLTLY
jgi:hypothetical protein